MKAGRVVRFTLFTLVTALLYGNSLRVPFLLDDPVPDMPMSWASRQLVVATMALNRAWSGADTWSFHLFNALAHLACAFLLERVLARALALARPRWAGRTHAFLASATALLWLCHPLQTAAVTYISQRAEILGALVYLGMAYGFFRSVVSPYPRRWQALVLILLGLGFATKETTATAPLLLWGFDVLFLSGGVRASLRARGGLYALLLLATLAGGLTFVAPLLFAEGSSAGLKFEGFGPLEYALTQPGVLLHYLKLVFWPRELCFDYGWPIARGFAEVALPVLVVSAALLWTAIGLARRHGAAFLAGFFFLYLAPTSSFVPIRDACFEHRMYLPLVAPLLGTLLVLRRCLPRRRRAPLAVGGILVLSGLLGTRTVLRNHDYRTVESLYSLTLAQAPHNARAHTYMGALWVEEGRLDEAARALEEALRLDPESGHAHLNYGRVWVRRGEPARALPHLRKAVERLDDPRAADALGHALSVLGEDAQAALCFAQALQGRPADAGLHFRQAHTLRRLGRNAEARAHFETSLALADDPEVAMRFAEFLVGTGELTAGLARAEAALARDDRLQRAHFVRGDALRQLGRFPEALQAFREARERAADRPEPLAAFAETVLAYPAASAAERAEALAAVERANELAGGANPGLLAVAARVQRAFGESEAAHALLTRALALPEVRADPARTAEINALLREFSPER